MRHYSCTAGEWLVKRVAYLVWSNPKTRTLSPEGNWLRAEYWITIAGIWLLWSIERENTLSEKELELKFGGRIDQWFSTCLSDFGI